MKDGVEQDIEKNIQQDNLPYIYKTRGIIFLVLVGISAVLWIMFLGINYETTSKNDNNKLLFINAFFFGLFVIDLLISDLLVKYQIKLKSDHFLRTWDQFYFLTKFIISSCINFFLIQEISKNIDNINNPVHIVLFVTLPLGLFTVFMLWIYYTYRMFYHISKYVLKKCFNRYFIAEN